MADGNHRNSTAAAAFDADDPFAELTRIMGFDPREAAIRSHEQAAGRQSAAAAMPVEAPAVPAPAARAEPEIAFDEADFSIDLEKELMGALAGESQFEPEIEAPRGFAPAFAQPVAAPAPVAYVGPVAVEPVIAPEPVVAAEPVFAEPEMAAPEAAAEEIPDDWFADIEFEDHAAAEAIESSGSHREVEPSFDPAPVLDAADEPLLAADDLPSVEMAARAHPVLAYEAAPAVAEASDEELDELFEEAVVDEDRDMDAFDVSEFIDGDDVSDLDRELDLSIAGELSALEAVEPEPAFAHSIPEAEPVAFAEPEMEERESLEEELNALLGNSLTQAVEPARIEVPPVPAPQAVAYPEPAPAEATPGFHIGAEELWADDDLALVDEEPVAAEPERFMPVEAQDADTSDLPEFDYGAFDDAMEAAAAAPVEEAGSLAEDEERGSAVSRDDHDPYAVLSALGATMSPSRPWSRETPIASAATRAPIAGPDLRRSISSSMVAATDPNFVPTARKVPQPANDFAPEIDTFDVPETPVALADDLDLPDVAFDDAHVGAPNFDDIDAEFSSLLDEMNASEAELAAAVEPSRYDGYAAPRQRRAEASPMEGASYADAAAIVAAVAAAGPQAISAAAPRVAQAAAPARQVPAPSTQSAADAAIEQGFADMEFAYDPDLDDEMSVPDYEPVQRQKRGFGRGMLIAAAIGGVAVLGGVGAFALSFGDGGGSEPALVKADAEPVKIKPENPGGTTIPNQDNKVYDTVAGGATTGAPAQESLISAAEEPVEIPSPVDEEVSDAAVGTVGEGLAKAEDRIDQLAQEAGVDETVEVAAVAPRKVRTMIVKSDGTLVAREDTAPATDAAPTSGTSELINAAAPSVPEPAVEPEAIADGAVEQDVALAPAVEPIEEPAAAPAPEPVPEPAVTGAAVEAPKAAPIAPARPVDQPVDIVGEVKADKVAAATTAAPAAGSWAMQIASQPTEAAAQSSYQDLARRYASVLDGRQATIVKAQIEGKGTFWRVRVPAGTRNEAVSLCESYKAAGGSCFVSR